MRKISMMRELCGGANALGLAILFSAVAAHAVAAAPSSVDYELTHRIALAAPGSQDYLTYEPGAHRLYVAHGPQVQVIDTQTGALVGAVGPFNDTHGIAIVSSAGKGYADSGDDGVVKVFDLATLKVKSVIKVSPDADGMVYDQATQRVLIVAGDPHDLTMIDVATDKVARVIALPGKPEFLALDGAGKVYINLMDLSQIAKVDIASGRVEASWPLTNCKTPKGLAFDAATNRLFSGCANGRMAVVDVSTGQTVANLPIGVGSDGVAVDSARGLAFSSNGEGTLTVIKRDAEDHYSVARTVPTFFGARTMSIDPKSGTLFIAHPVLKRDAPPKPGAPAPLKFTPDTLDLAVFEPRF